MQTSSPSHAVVGSQEAFMPSLKDALSHLAFTTSPGDGCLDVKFFNTFKNAQISLWGFEGMDQAKIDTMLRRMALRFFTIVDPDDVFKAVELQISIVDLGLFKQIDISPQGILVTWNPTIDGCLMKKNITAEITKACVELIAENAIPALPGTQQDQLEVNCITPTEWSERDATEQVQKLLQDRKGGQDSTFVQISVRNRATA